MDKPLEVVPGSWDVEIAWTPEASELDKQKAVPFITELSANVQEGKDEVPECIERIIISRA